jgi:preprotein translocase subunit SecE
VANIIQYIEESYNELVHKVTWPTWDQLQSSSIVVLVASVIFALLIFAMDFIFGINVKFIEGQAEFSAWPGILGFYYDLIGAYRKF